MIVTRLYTDSQGDSQFEDREIELFPSGEIGALSPDIPVKSMVFRETSGDYNYDFHNAPRKQYIALLDGIIEIETSLGEKRQFSGGEVLLVEDTTGKGHRTRSVDHQPRRSLFIVLE